ncbi:MAG: hypothetical protein RJA70_1903 [Pseudomonadota bacterium]|jgi:3-isopropylmalate dehydrogenase
MTSIKIAVLPGDGIGREVTPACVTILKQLQSLIGGFQLEFQDLPAGALHFRDTGVSLPKASMDACRAADAILLGAMGWPEIRYDNGTEIAPQIEIRFELGLYAGVRPVKVLPSLPTPLRVPEGKTIDFVLIRESTEGLFASHGKGELIGDHEARDTMVITRNTCERLFDFAFKLGATRKAAGSPGRVTCVDKANVFTSMAFFRKIFDERSKAFPDLVADHAYVDATALNMVKKPWDFDVLVTENMFGDILSDLGAGLMGGMGMAPSADIGDNNAVFQPCHGSAPDIAGQGKANPTATILSGALMLDWLSHSTGNQSLARAASILNQAAENTFLSPDMLPYELGGQAGTQKITNAIAANVEALVKGR